ncbi:biotin carboxylase N-terminal domain-containing protein [Bacillus licheniformis]|nr:biotin carboxylase N-terminal domain-containing protein [Bacillus licheniformis]
MRVFRACTELNIRTVAIYSKEDSGSYHRYKADEAYLVGEGKSRLTLILILKASSRLQTQPCGCHPSRLRLPVGNIQFAKRSEEEGIIFIGPTSEHLDMFGDKVKPANKLKSWNSGHTGERRTSGGYSGSETICGKFGYPFIIKASLGGGGRGMRIVRDESELEESYNRAKSEAKAAFGNDEVYVES